jgi:Na+/citrate or Na+/malate symporter
VDTRIGIVPIPIYVILVGLIAGFTYTGDIKGEVSIMIAVLVIGGFTCAEIGKRTPVLRNIGAAAIFATFIPSALAYYKLLPPQLEKSVIEFTKYTNFLYLFIACIIVGSILGMDRRVLVKGFLKIFVPLAVGSIVAGIVGTLVGTLLGLGAYHTFFFVVVPIMAGGVGEGAIPLSVGYSEILSQPQGDVFAQVLPPVMLGSLTAILFAGTLNFVGKRYPHLTGEGRLQPGEHDDMDTAREDTEDEKGAPIDVGTVAAAGLAAITLYLLEPIREVWIHGEVFAASRLSMIRIMARRMKATTVLACRSKSRASLRLRAIQAKVRSTIHRLGRTMNLWASARLTMSSFQAPVSATTFATLGP